ncbi:hypothetical protein [Saltatorellus ferox]
MTISSLPAASSDPATRSSRASFEGELSPSVETMLSCALGLTATGD